MTASDMNDQRVSEFFLALLEGTGWYTPNYEMSEPMFWGKGKGCGFLDATCINPAKETNFPDHFCTDLGEETCSFDRTAYGLCGSDKIRKFPFLEPYFNYWGDGTFVNYDSYADNCPYRKPENTICEGRPSLSATISDKEYFGPQSACFTGNLYGGNYESPFCFKKSVRKTKF